PGSVEEILLAYGYTGYVYEGLMAGAVQLATYLFDATRADHQSLDQFPAALRVDPSLDPYEFGVFIAGSQAAADEALIREKILRAQNLRSHLQYIRYELP
ncbi:MAG: hypothetical protein ACE5FJ_08665, partial [Gemmatimonadales bacterium]